MYGKALNIINYLTRRTIVTLSVAVVLPVFTVHAQTQTSVAPVVGYEFGVQREASHLPGEVNRFASDGSGTSLNNTYRFGGRVDFSAVLGRFGVSGLLGGTYSDGLFTSTPYNDSTAGTANEFLLHSYGWGVVGEIGLQYSVSDLIRFGLGSRIAIPLASGYRLSERILSPNSAMYPDSSREIVASTGDSLQDRSLRFGVVLSGAVRVPLTSALSLEPGLFVHCDLTSLQSGLGARAFSAGLDLALVWNRVPDPIPSDTLITTHRDTLLTPVPIPRLDASVSFHSRDRMPNTDVPLTVHSVHHRLQMPLLQVIFVHPGDVGIPEEYVRLNPEAAGSFSVSSLARRDPLFIQQNVLNILGLRMRNNPMLNITLHSVFLRTESSETARLRARTVRDYLKQTYGIDTSRVTITITQQAKRRFPAPCIEVTSSAAGLLSDVVVDWTEQEYRLPELSVRKHIESEAGVREGTLTIRQGSRVVGRYPVSETPLLSGMDIMFSVGSRQLPPLIAELEVTDSSGQQAFATDTLRIGYDSSRNTIAERIECIVLDCFGGEKLQRQLSALRVVLMRDTLRDRTVTISGAGSAERSTLLASLVTDQIRTLAKKSGSGQMSIKTVSRDTLVPSVRSLPIHTILEGGVTVSIESSR